MSNHKCLECRHAAWDRSATGRLSPTGDGWCKFVYRNAPIPASMYWIGRSDPKPDGGFINRRRPIVECPCYQPKEGA